jgi:condensin complex subunit 3
VVSDLRYWRPLTFLPFRDQNPRQFVKLWLDLLNRVLVQSKKHQSVERLVKIISLAAVSFDEAFRDFTVQYIIRKTDARDWAPRFRACQILSQTLKALPEDAELGDAIWDEIYVRMRDRLDDRAPAVRAEAVCAVQRLQDPTDPADPIVSRFIEMMQEDPSGDVRKTVVCNVAICKATLKEIVHRTRDVHPPTRRASFRVLANYVNIKNLKISQRTELLSDGLKDRDEKVQKECAKMCLSWLANCEQDVLTLLRLVDVEVRNKRYQKPRHLLFFFLKKTYKVAEEGAEELLKILFRDAQGGCPVRVDPNEKLSSEAALYMRVISDYWRKKVDDINAQEAFETQVPELSAVCKMMEMNTGNDFVLKQLLLIASMRDFSDEVGRMTLSSLLRSLLPSPQISQFLVEPIIKVLSQCHSYEQEFIQVVLEMVADVREPLDLLQSDEARAGFHKALQRRDEMRVTYAKLKKIARISTQQKQHEQAAKAERKALALKAELDAAEESIATRSRVEEHIWYRILCVTELMLESTKQGGRHPGLHSLLDGVLMPSLAQTSTVIRVKALRCLAMYCLLDRTTTTVHMHIKKFLDATQTGELEERLTAVKSLFDIGMLYGFKSVKEDDLISRLSKYVTDEAEDQQMRGLVVEGFAKLFLMGQCHDETMLGNLLMLFFAPSTGKDVRLRQCLSVFFPTFAFSLRVNQALCAKTAIPTLRRLLLADPSSSFRKIDWSLFCKFLAHLTDSRHATYDFIQNEAEPSWNEQIILDMAYEMRGPEKSFGQYWARAMSHYVPRDPHVNGKDEASAKRLYFVAKLHCAVLAAAEECTDKRAQQWTEKRAAAILQVVNSSKQKDNFTEVLRNEVSDEVEVEVETYLETRNAIISALVASGAAFRHAAEDMVDNDDDDLPEGGEAYEPKQKKLAVKLAAKEPSSKAARKTAATVAVPGAVKKAVAVKKAAPKPVAAGWGISVAGQEDKKRKPALPAAPQQEESPPKKEKIATMAGKRKEASDVDEESERGENESASSPAVVSPWKRDNTAREKKTKKVLKQIL